MRRKRNIVLLGIVIIVGMNINLNRLGYCYKFEEKNKIFEDDVYKIWRWIYLYVEVYYYYKNVIRLNMRL